MSDSPPARTVRCSSPRCRARTRTCRVDSDRGRSEDRPVLISRLGTVAALVGLCGGLCGCAAGQREVGARNAAADFLAAMTDGDTRVACALLATNTREDLESSGGQPCTSALEAVAISGEAVDQVAVWGDRAQVRTSAGVVFLVELDTGWRVAAAGCSRADNGTYDCLLAA